MIVCTGGDISWVNALQRAQFRRSFTEVVLLLPKSPFGQAARVEYTHFKLPGTSNHEAPPSRLNIEQVLDVLTLHRSRRRLFNARPNALAKVLAVHGVAGVRRHSPSRRCRARGVSRFDGPGWYGLHTVPRVVNVRERESELVWQEKQQRPSTCNGVMSAMFGDTE